MKIIIFIFIFCGIIHSEISRSYSQVMHKLDNSFYIERSTDVKGKPRYMGYSSNGLATIEMIGNKRNLYSASLMIGIPNNNKTVVATNCSYAILFLSNVCGMTNGIDWLIIGFDKGENVYYGNNCTVKLSIIKSLGMVLITVE